MPDLSIEYYYHCHTSEHFSTLVRGSKGQKYHVTFGRMPPNHRVQYDWTCTCQGFKFRRTCKHIAIAEKRHCGWYQFTDGGEPINGKCPKCQGEIRSQGHGV